MRKHPLFNGIAIGLSAALLAGCASNPPTAADFMRDEAAAEHLRADLKGQIAADWDKGARLVKSGKENVAEGEKLIESSNRNLQKGREQLELGRRETAEGNRLLRESEQRYRDALPDSEPPAGRLERDRSS